MRSSKRSWLAISSVLIIFVLSSFVLFGCEHDREIERSEATGSKTVNFKDNELTIQGSDTLLELSQRWVEVFSEEHPEVLISVSGGGSGVGIAALINKTIDFANASRKIKENEIQLAKNSGLAPQEYIVTYDCISIIVNKNNPVDELTIEQLSKIFSGEVTNWSEIGGSNADIIVASRDSSSGTYAYFKEKVVQMGGTVTDRDYTQNALFLSSNITIREEVSSDEDAVGYIGLSYLNDTVKAIKVKEDKSSESVEPSIENVKDGSYPISRPLYMYAPDKDLTDLEQSFLDFVTGEKGQAIALEVGFVPIR